jgi:hypothetical protein
VIEVRGEVDVINPDTRRSLNANGITGVGKYLANLDVADDDVFNVQDADANATES